MGAAEMEGHNPASEKWSPLRPPPRLRGHSLQWQGSSTDAGICSAGASSSVTPPATMANGERSGSGGVPGLTDGGAQETEQRLRGKIQKALKDESMHRLRQKLMAENGTSGLTPPESSTRRSTPADLTAEARQQAKSRARVRPLLPPKGPSWSAAGGSANMTYMPALSIEARSVHPPGSSSSNG